MTDGAAEFDLFERLDQPAWFELREMLDLRQWRLLESAIAFHSLVSPGRTLTYQVHLGEDWQYPRLTDEDRYHEQSVSGSRLLGTVCARSAVTPTSDFATPMLTVHGTVAADRNTRHILLTSSSANDEAARARHANAWDVRVYDFLQERQPIVLDAIRDYFWKRFERDRDRHHPPRQFADELARLRESTPQKLPIPRIAGPSRAGAPGAVLIGMHWLQSGGAERWAIETVGLVRDAGLVPIVVTDRDSHHPWITRSELNGALVLCLTHPMAGFPGDEPLLRALVEQFDLRGVLVHHCQWLYDRLALLRLSRPDLEVVDSLHVLEPGGGFPRASAVASPAITWHHTISQQIRDWLVTVQQIDSAKVVFAPLSGLTIAESQLRSPNSPSTRPFTVAFIGRKARQKRPEAFLLLVRRAMKEGLALRAIMHGDGELDGVTDRLIDRYGLRGIVEVRSSDVPVGRTLSESDLLAITSSSEGITLTTFEAVSAGVPVISADVGAQSEVVPVDALLPRATWRMIPAATKILKRLQAQSTRIALLERERAAIARMAERPDAGHWMKEVIERWAQ